MKKRRDGITLVELLLVLAIMAAVGVFAWTAMAPVLAHHRLQAAADAVRSECARARTDAMKSGHIYQLRYMVNGDQFHLSADGSATPAPAVAATTPAATSAGGASSDATSVVSPDAHLVETVASAEADCEEEPLPPSEDGTLPATVRFLPGSSSGDSPETIDDAEPEKAAATTDADDNWSEPIYFYPDGSTSDAKIRISGEHESTLQLVLRGVTGTVSEGNEKTETQ